MAIPTSSVARLFYRCAFQRFEDAQILLHANRTTGAVYLAGYSVECILKALVLADLAGAAQDLMLNFFRGARAHNYEWLRTLYLEHGGARFPREVTAAFTLVNDWSTELRYAPRALKFPEADGLSRCGRSNRALGRWEAVKCRSRLRGARPMRSSTG